MRLILIGLLTAIVALSSGCKKEDKAARTAKEPAAMAVEGAAAPDFGVKDLNGKDVRLASFKGKVVLVNFWATWCPPCREEMPSMMKLNQTMAGKQFQMMAISIDEGGKGAVESYLRKSGISLPAYLDSETAAARIYGTTGVPETFIIDKTGIIRKKIVGAMDWSTPEVITFLDDLLKK